MTKTIGPVKKHHKLVCLLTKFLRMYQHETTVRVRYAETDQMNIVYYGNYAQYLEVGRVESIRNLGYSYKQMETMGIRMPVVKMEISYLRPAHYDELLTIKSSLTELSENHQIQFYQEVYNEQQKLITKGIVTLFFIDRETGKKTKMPVQLKEKLAPYFEL